MSCRRIESLLSAFVDFELTGAEMLSIRKHLSECVSCEAEYQSIASLKQLLNSLPSSRPRPQLGASLEELSSFNPVVVHLFRPQREMRRLFGLASAEENNRALQQANGHSAGLACALGVLGAWFVVAPAAIAPVLSHLQSHHSRWSGIMSMTGFGAPIQTSRSTPLVMTSAGDMNSLDDTSMTLSSPPSALTRYSSDAPILTLGYSEERSYQIRPVLNTMSSNAQYLGVTPRARLYSAKFNASR